MIGLLCVGGGAPAEPCRRAAIGVAQRRYLEEGTHREPACGGLTRPWRRSSGERG